MPKIGILVIGRDYYRPYMKWLSSSCDISAILTNSRDMFSDIGGNFVDEEPKVLDDSDLVISLGYWKKISKKAIDSVPLGIVNIHHSYQLKYRGRHMFTWAIQNGETHHGSSIHYMSENIDDGPIIATDRIPIEVDDTAGSLLHKVNKLGLRLLKEALPSILDGTAVTMAPNPDFHSHREAELSHEIPSDELGSPNRLYDLVRSLTFAGKPIPYVLVGGHRIYLHVSDPGKER